MHYVCLVLYMYAYGVSVAQYTLSEVINSGGLIAHYHK